MAKPKDEVGNKSKEMNREPKPAQSNPSVLDTDTTNSMILGDLKRDETLWYRLKVLLYDLRNVTKDPSCEQRLSSTTNELYISEPYFPESEALRIRSTLSTSSCDESGKPLTIEKALQRSLEDFFNKRRANGDARPCGPHDLFPVYATVFEIEREALKDEKFRARLRRSGLGTQSQPKEVQSKDHVKSKDHPETSKKGR